MLCLLSTDLSYNTFLTFIPLINRHKQYLEQSEILKVPYETMFRNVKHPGT
jgi:hypothetical protein